MPRMTQDELAARTFLYTFFHRLTSAELDETLDGEGLAAVLGDAAEVLGLQNNGAMRGLLDALPLMGDLPARRREFMRLYVGPAKLIAPPWESVYAEQGRSLFTATTLDVRNAYRAQGMLPAAYPHVADDHLSIELDFMAQLARAMQAAQEEGRAQDEQDARKASADFLAAHLLRWVPAYAGEMARKAKADDGTFYPTAMAALAAFLRADAALLQ